MSEDSRQANVGTGKRKRRSAWLVYSLELSLGVLCGLVLFGLLLLALDVWFPDATGLGVLVRTPETSRTAGQRLDFARNQEALVAVLSSIRRDVRDKPAVSVVWHAAYGGKGLGDLHAVQSYANSGATITFDEEHFLQLGEKSLIVVRRPQRIKGSRRRRASLLFMDGFVRGRLGGGDTGDLELELVANGGTIRQSQGSEADAEVALAVQNVTSALSVLKGSAELVWGNEVTLVPEGHMVTYDPTTPPGVPIPLPRPPRMISPARDALYRYRSSPPEVPFRWRPVDDVTEFRVQLALDPRFESMVHDEVYDAAGFIHGNLAAGEYHWRTIALRGLVASPPSASRRLVIEQDRQSPPLEVHFPEEKVDVPVVALQGVTEPDCRVLIGGELVAVLEDGSFRHELRLRSGYNFIVVQAIDGTGNTAFRNHTVIAELTEFEEVQ